MPKNVICGEGTINRLSPIVEELGGRNIVVLVDGGVLKSGSLDNLLNQLDSVVPHMALVTDIPAEPEDRHIKEVYYEVTGSNTELVVAICGGSVMDTAKMVSVLINNPEYKENIVDNSLIKNPGVPLIVAPTSAGTGSEATPNAIVLLPDKKLKVGVVHDYFLPSQVVLDPELTIE